MRPKNLVRDTEVERLIALMRKNDLPIGAVEVRTDGVIIHPPATQAGSTSAYENWKNGQKKDAASDRPAHR
jgi:hypothetical protein